MRGNADSTGVESNSGYKMPPEGDYSVQISEVGEQLTSNGDPMAKPVLEIVSGEYKGCKIWDNIVIPKEGSPAFKIMGRTKHFLHCINEPYEGKFSYNTDNWLFKRVKVSVKHEIQKSGKNEGKPKCVISAYILDESLNQTQSAWDDAPAL